MTGNLYSGLLDFNEMGLIIHFLRKEDLFFDIGANVGIYTLIASGIGGAATRSFEPVPDTYAILKGNIVINNLEEKVQLYNMGVGEENEVLEFSSDQDTENTVVNSDYTGRKVKVKIIKLDDEFSQQINQCTVLKIDTEGFEDKVLAGSAAILSSAHVKMIIVEMNKPEKIKRILAASGFLPYTYDAITRNLLQTDYDAGNMIFIKDVDFVRSRISTAGRTEIRKGQFI